ncbi:uncharacterized protein BYT42DRAFT_613430 [Radiomyces spectabilis]|uniref:uncharacterized protein n=1 Tax=Radiomyces spectabilis TaxID=64574 RepID=UPI00221FE5A8|nr:uncharacterized protein BYT42DRAFT_613430 [Radiomyces spectabilis]KAI8379093.1 hypothetical protein BYT42DRAFT_613430 [Radiomyces spectabilis]
MRLEDYRRITKSAGDPTQEDQLPPPAENEIRISQSGKINRYVEIGLTMLKEQQKSNIVIVGKGVSVNKAVSVVEIIKRRMEGTLHQYTQLGSVKTVEKWDPVQGKKLETMLVHKHIPMIIIHLSLNVMPQLEESSGYQPPTGNDIYM